MVAISWETIWLFDSVQFDENAAKETIINNKTSKIIALHTLNDDYFKVNIQTN